MQKYLVKINGESKEFDKKVSILDLLSDEQKENKNIICAKVNNRIRDLSYELHYDADVELLDLSSHQSMKMYEASLRYLVAMAFARKYPGLKIRFAYNISRCVSVHILGNEMKASKDVLKEITDELSAIVQADYPLNRLVKTNAEAEKIYDEMGFADKKAILEYRPEKTVHFYECDGYLDYMYCHLVPSTGYIKSYKIMLYGNSFLIQYPRAECGGKIPDFTEEPSYGRTLTEIHDWAKVVGISTVAGINEEVKSAGSAELINICENRHNRQLVELGDLIENNLGTLSMILVAGPSSSGKTTFANRLRIELLSRGIKPIRISTDDFYLSREKTPLGPDGEPDFETIEAIDIPYFNECMLSLISGEETELPKYDFTIGDRVKGRTVKLGKDEPIIIEGIHALNDRLTFQIPKSEKFKIFISPQAQINLDDHNPLSLTDLRLLRRLVRDKQFRNSPAEETFSLWPKVRAGEFKWIYPYQEGSDYVFNSFLPYELAVMKKFALPLLSSIPQDSPYYQDALRLKSMLKFFIEVPDKWVPSNSLMREFLGGSCYADV